jgi:hypothetical protein
MIHRLIDGELVETDFSAVTTSASDNPRASPLLFAPSWCR